MQVRRATPHDAEALARLLSAYLAESFPDHPGTAAERLADDVLANPHGQRVVVAERGGELVGFMSWHPVYDMHWGASGAAIADLYVEPASRGHGVALSLTVELCAIAREEGGSFLRGAAYDRDSATGRFYERFAIGFDSAECHCGGRAFRELADLRGSSPKEVARSLPPKEWNFQP